MAIHHRISLSLAVVLLAACVQDIPPKVSETATVIKDVTVEGATKVKDATVDGATTVADGATAVKDGTVERVTKVVESIAQKAETLLGDDDEAAAPAELDPSDLYGLSKDELIARFGEADYERIDGDTEILQYRMDSCVVDFVLSMENGTLTMTSWHGRHRTQGEDFDEQACRVDLAARDRL